MNEDARHDPFFKIEEVFAFRDLLGDETDRGCALTAAAYLDAELESLLRHYFVDNKDIADNLLGANRPLGSFAARIDLSYMLGLIPKLAARDLHLIRKIRNEFAHNPWTISFDTPEIASRCRELRHDTFQEKLLPRKRFMRVATGVSAFIHMAMATETRREPKKDIDIASPPLKELIADFKDVFLQYMKPNAGSNAVDPK